MSDVKKNNAFAVRCHFVGEKEKALYKFAESYFGKENTFFVINSEDKNLQVPQRYNHVLFNKDTILNYKELFWARDIGWKCGDYCYYALNSVLSSYEYIWMAEPDLKICSEKAEDFFKAFEKHDFDFLATFLGKANKQLFFYPTARVLEAEPMSCLFPITRIKSEKIKILYDIRKKVSAKFIKGELPAKDYPNDEIFVATVSKRMGMNCAALDRLTTFNFMLFRADKDTVFLDSDVEQVKGRFLLHPVLDKDVFIKKRLSIFRGVLRQSAELGNWTHQTLSKIEDQDLKKTLQEKFLDEFKIFLGLKKPEENRDDIGDTLQGSSPQGSTKDDLDKT
tara:strand:+ start:4989 stop:5996 length:1008 start_codon:yes stop_codon:yes gene_type:complete